MSKELTEAKRKAIKKYDAANTKQYHLKLNMNTDAEIIQHIDMQQNVQGYIKALIKADIGCKTINTDTDPELDCLR